MLLVIYLCVQWLASKRDMRCVDSSQPFSSLLLVVFCCCPEFVCGGNPPLEMDMLFVCFETDWLFFVASEPGLTFRPRCHGVVCFFVLVFD